MREECGSAGGGTRDTESKTRTPHKDVGEKIVRPVLGARACLTRSHKCAGSGSFAEL